VILGLQDFAALLFVPGPASDVVLETVIII